MGGSQLTLEQALYLGQLAWIVKFPEIFRFLGQILSLDSRVSLVGQDLRRRAVEASGESCEVDI
jgi:hypothetical protein